MSLILLPFFAAVALLPLLVHALVMPSAMNGLTSMRVAAQGTGVFVGCAVDDRMLFNTSDELYFPMHKANYMMRYG